MGLVKWENRASKTAYCLKDKVIKTAKEQDKENKSVCPYCGEKVTHVKGQKIQQDHFRYLLCNCTKTKKFVVKGAKLGEQVVKTKRDFKVQYFKNGRSLEGVVKGETFHSYESGEVVRVWAVQEKTENKNEVSDDIRAFIHDPERYPEFEKTEPSEFEEGFHIYAPETDSKGFLPMKAFIQTKNQWREFRRIIQVEFKINLMKKIIENFFKENEERTNFSGFKLVDFNPNYIGKSEEFLETAIKKVENIMNITPQYVDERGYSGRYCDGKFTGRVVTLKKGEIFFKNYADLVFLAESLGLARVKGAKNQKEIKEILARLENKKY